MNSKQKIEILDCISNLVGNEKVSRAEKQDFINQIIDYVESFTAKECRDYKAYESNLVELIDKIKTNPDGNIWQPILNQLEAHKIAQEQKVEPKVKIIKKQIPEPKQNRKSLLNFIISKKFLKLVIMLIVWVAIVSAALCVVCSIVLFALRQSFLAFYPLYAIIPIFISACFSIFFMVAAVLHLENQEKIVASIDNKKES